MWLTVKSLARRAAPWLLLGAGIYWLSAPAARERAAAFPVGGRLPALDLALADGSRVEVAARAPAVLVLNFWASYCAPCRAEAPILSSVHARGAGVRVIGLSIEGLPKQRMLAAAQALGMRYPIAAVDLALLQRLRVAAVPTTYVIATDGVITLSRVGEVTQRELDAAIASAKRRG